MRSLQQELEQLREDRERERELAARRAKQDEEDLQILRDRLEAVEGGGISVCFPAATYDSASLNFMRTIRAIRRSSINCGQTWRDS